MSFSERLKIAIGDKSLRQFAKECNLTSTTLHKYLHGSMPSIDKAVRIANVANVSLQWLATGKLPAKEKEYTGLDYLESTSMKYHDTMMDVVTLEPPDEGLLPSSNTQDMAYITIRDDVYASAGTGNFLASDETEKRLAVPRRFLEEFGIYTASAHVITIQGNSMSPILSPGDKVLINTADKNLEDGCIYILYFDNRIYCKSTQLRSDGLTLISANQEYEKIFIPRESFDQLQVLGRAICKTVLL